jgi:WD40 repeat protein
VHSHRADACAETDEVIQTLGNGADYHTGNIIRSLWSATDQHILTCSDDCTIRKWDVEVRSYGCTCTVALAKSPRMQTGKMVGIIDEDHTKGIQDIQFSKDKTHFISSSIDQTAKVKSPLREFRGAMNSSSPRTMTCMARGADLRFPCDGHSSAGEGGNKNF